MSETNPTVYIIDDDPSARRGLTRLIRAGGKMTKSFTSAADFLASEDCEGPGCILLDVQMPGLTGPQLQEKLSGDASSMPIIFLSAYGDVPMTAAAMKKGALDFLVKPVDRDDLLAAIEAALAQDAASRAQWDEREQNCRQFDVLTRREYEVMTYVIAGLLNKQIAAALDIAEDTVKIHRGRVMRKLGIVSVAQLVRLCEKAGLEPAVS